MNKLPYTQACHLILQSISDGVFTVDFDWRVTSFNKAAEHITGLRGTDVIGKPCHEIFQSSICNGCKGSSPQH